MKCYFQQFVVALGGALLFSALNGCGKKVDSYPRPEAFPRVALLDSAFVEVDSLPLHFEANSGAVTRRGDAPGAFDVIYPTYGATIYCAVNHASDSQQLSAITANRLERMELNTGGAPVEVIELSSADGSFSSQLVVSASSRVVPLQFLSVGGPDGLTIVSGAATFDMPYEGDKQDSVKPYVDALRRDIMHSLKTLSK